MLEEMKVLQYGWVIEYGHGVEREQPSILTQGPDHIRSVGGLTFFLQERRSP